jgi:hypothetical protein
MSILLIEHAPELDNARRSNQRADAFAAAKRRNRQVISVTLADRDRRRFLS